MTVFCDGTCPVCGGHTYNRDGGPPTCRKCGWMADRKAWDDDMQKVKDVIDRTIDTFLANYGEDTP